MLISARNLGLAVFAMALFGACSAEDTEEFIGTTTQPVTVAAPGRVQAESYERANESTPGTNSGGKCDRADGVDMQTSADPSGGSCYVGWTTAGEWLEYTVSSSTARTFNIKTRVASGLTSKTFHLVVNGTNLPLQSAPSSGWESWQDRIVANVALPAGTSTIRVVFDTGDVNFDWFEFTASTSTPNCNDGVKNGTETGIDCGGPCAACSPNCVEKALLRVEAVASSVRPATLAASNVIDGNSGTRWSSEYSSPQWIYVDLGATRKISRVVLNWETAASKNYDLQVATNPKGPWKTVYTTAAGNGGVDDIRRLSEQARYVRMYSRARLTSAGVSLFEFQVYGDNNASCIANCVFDRTNTTSLTMRHADIGARQILSGIAGGARLARDPVSGKLHYMTLNGDIHQVTLGAGNTSTSQRVIAGTDIVSGLNVSPSTYQGMAFASNGTLYVVANVDLGTTSKAIVRRGTGSGTRTWTTFAQTDPYADSNTPFDHHFSGIVVSPDGAYVYLTSGSRTDHGEVQDTGGAFPGTREVPLTAAMFRLPTSGSNLLLKNDTAALQTAGYLHARGLRNSFDPTFNGIGELFAGDNGPDADYSEELNLIQRGKHYGFPWKLGGENNSQQFSSYNPATDPRLHPGFHAVDTGTYRNDPTFPAAPTGLITPLRNRGPAADQFRDVATGGVVDARDSGRNINTFTGHRVPLGLSFDIGGNLCGGFQNQALILSWGSAVPVFSDKGEDVLLLKFFMTTTGYEIEAHQMVTGLSRPIDSVLLGNKLYVLEYADGATGRLFEITFPRHP